MGEGRRQHQQDQAEARGPDQRGRPFQRISAFDQFVLPVNFGRNRQPDAGIGLFQPSAKSWGAASSSLAISAAWKSGSRYRPRNPRAAHR